MKEVLIFLAAVIYLTFLTVWSFNGPPWTFQRTAPYGMVFDNK